MGWKYRGRIKIAKGVHLNLGKKGINSLSVGSGPFTTNINKKGVKNTVGLHGTGLSYQSDRQRWADEDSPRSSGLKTIFWFIVMCILLVLVSK